MKVTFVLPEASMCGGVRVVATYAHRLRQRGHEVLVVSQPPPLPPLKQRVRLALRWQGWIGGPEAEESFVDHMNLPHLRLRQRGALREGDVPDADVIIATWWETAEWIGGLSPRKGIKAHLIQHYETWGGPPARVEAVWRMPLRRIVISRWLAELAQERFGDCHTYHVPNSVDMELFNAEVRGKQDRPTVGVLYSEIPFKGIDVSLKALELARQKLPELKVLSFGLRDPYPQWPLPPGTRFDRQPQQKEIARIYRRCDAWLCGSRAEGFHLPPLEAMACRCPVVSTRVGGPMDTIEEGVNGHLVDVGDYQALAEKLLKVLTLPQAQWQAMSEAAHATARNYTWDDAAARLEEALEDMLGSQRRIGRSQARALAG